MTNIGWDIHEIQLQMAATMGVAILDFLKKELLYGFLKNRADKVISLA